jgi:hypothetical protein
MDGGPGILGVWSGEVMHVWLVGFGVGVDMFVFMFVFIHNDTDGALAAQVCVPFSLCFFGAHLLNPANHNHREKRSYVCGGRNQGAVEFEARLSIMTQKPKPIRPDSEPELARHAAKAGYG